MADIKDTVGAGATNRVHDVALLQALLLLVKDAKGQLYLRSYDGIFGNQTKTAIISYQKDHGLALVPKVAAPPGAKLPGVGAKPGAKPPAVPLTEALGMVKPGAATIKHLTAALVAAGHTDLHVVPETKVVYWPGLAADAARASTTVANNADLEPTFRANVVKLIDQMYQKHKIVLSIPGSGSLRTFQQQYGLATTPTKSGGFVTGAGPGESNHNFGIAVDIGFNGFKWMTSTGAPEIDDYWLAKMPVAKRESLWKARNQVATPFGLYKTALAGDFIHLQNFDDAKVSMGRSLAGLLNAVGTMKWSVAGQVYSSDLGLGGKLYPVGKSEDVWGLKSNITEAILTGAQEAAAKAAAAKAAAPGAKAAAPAKAAKVTPADVKAMKAKLKADFETAETHRLKWKPLP